MSDEVRAIVPRDKLERVRKDIVEMLPGMGKVPPGVQLAAAYVTIAYDLDPFMGDLWPIPQRVKGQVVGYALMFGITARQKVAHRSGQYQGRRIRWLTEQEAEFFDVRLDQGDKAIACEVWRKGIEEPFVGYGIVHFDDQTRMAHGACAILRAERNALKAAFPVELPPTLVGVDQVTIEDLEADEDLIIEGEAVEVVYPTKNEIHTHGKPKAEYDQGELGPLGMAVQRGHIEHWIADAPTRAQFWAWAGQDLGLSNDEVHQALGAESVYDFPGTKREARDKILAWVAEQSKVVSPPGSVQQDMEDLFGPQEVR